MIDRVKIVRWGLMKFTGKSFSECVHEACNRDIRSVNYSIMTTAFLRHDVPTSDGGTIERERERCNLKFCSWY